MGIIQKLLNPLIFYLESQPSSQLSFQRYFFQLSKDDGVIEGRNTEPITKRERINNCTVGSGGGM